MHGNSSSRLAKDRDVVWITSEVDDVVLDPLQGQDHILHGVVTGRVTIASAQESQDAQTIVQGDVDDIVGDKVLWAVHGIIARAQDKGSAVNPDHDGTLVDNALGVDVQEQAIFVSQLVANDAGHGATVSVLAGIPNTGPSLMRDGIPEAQVTNWRLCVGNSFPGKVTISQETSALLDTTDLSSGCVDHQVIEGGGRRVQVGHGAQDDDQRRQFKHFHYYSTHVWVILGVQGGGHSNLYPLARGFYSWLFVGGGW